MTSFANLQDTEVIKPKFPRKVALYFSACKMSSVLAPVVAAFPSSRSFGNEGIQRKTGRHLAEDGVFALITFEVLSNSFL